MDPRKLKNTDTVDEGAEGNKPPNPIEVYNYATNEDPVPLNEEAPIPTNKEVEDEDTDEDTPTTSRVKELFGDFTASERKNIRDAQKYNKNYDVHSPTAQEIRQQFYKSFLGEDLYNEATRLHLASVSQRQQQDSKVYKFHFAGMSENMDKAIEMMIEKLGGEALRCNTYDSSCTHLIFERLDQTEKVMCAVASGKWILNIKYIYDSFTANRFLSEEDYEAGNENFPYLTQLNDGEKKVAKAGFRWRQKINGLIPGEVCDGAFVGITCLLLLEHQTDAFVRLIEAGKGRVLHISTLISGDNQKKDVTHVFFTHKDQITAKDRKYLQKQNVHILSQEYITAHLFDESNPDPTLYQF